MSSKQSTERYAEDVVKEIKADFLARQRMRRPYELGWQLNMNFVMGNQYCQVGPRGSIEHGSDGKALFPQWAQCD